MAASGTYEVTGVATGRASELPDKVEAIKGHLERNRWRVLGYSTGSVSGLFQTTFRVKFRVSQLGATEGAARKAVFDACWQEGFSLKDLTVLPILQNLKDPVDKTLEDLGQAAKGTKEAIANTGKGTFIGLGLAAGAIIAGVLFLRLS